MKFGAIPGRDLSKITVSETETEESSDCGHNKASDEQKEYVLYGHNAHFGWQVIHESMIHKSLFNLAKEHPHQILKIPAGGREQIVSDEDFEDIDHIPIKKIFQISSITDPLYGSCQWIAAAMLINEDDEIQAIEMMDILRSDPDSFNWKYMFKDDKSLAEMLQKITKYKLKKVSRKPQKNQHDVIDFLLSSAEGKYVCLLQDNNYVQSHVVGVDCSVTPKLIYDCAERNALLLSRENLDRCTGKNTVCRIIKTIGEIVLKTDP